MRTTLLSATMAFAMIGCKSNASKLKIDLSKVRVADADVIAAEALVEPLLVKNIAQGIAVPATVDCSQQESLSSFFLGTWWRNELGPASAAIDQCLASDSDAFKKMPAAGALAALMLLYADNTDARAKALIEDATTNDQDPEQKFSLFSYWYFDEGTTHTWALDKMLRSTQWNDRQKIAIKQLLSIDAGSDLAFNQDGMVSEFIDEELNNANNNDRYKGQLAAVALRQFNHRYFYSSGIDFLLKHPQALNTVFFMQSPTIIYDNLFKMPNVGPNIAGKIYAAYAPYMDRTWELPIDDNSYTYTEIYQNLCTDHLLSPDQLKAYKLLSNSWFMGKVTTDQALAQATAMLQSNPDKSDLLTFIATLQLANGLYADAEDNYWQAHLFCIYYDRAHDGLKNAMTIKNWRTNPDYQTVQTKEQAALAGLTAPKTISTFINGYANLAADEQLAIQFGLRKWYPYIDSLSAKNLHLTILWPDSLLSDLPAKQDDRDQRVTLPFDNRLYDDIGGVDEPDVAVVRLGSLFDGMVDPDDHNNVVTHEVAHQMHGAFFQNLDPCIKKLYARAKQRGKTVDAYAMNNTHEYFATTYTWYSVDPDAIQKLDPDFYTFAKLIDAGDLSKVACN